MELENPVNCPCGECKLKEYKIDGYPVGIRYGCVGGKTDDAMFAGQGFRSWVCHKSWLAYRKLRDNKDLPQEDKTLVVNTRRIRASMRPSWLDRFFQKEGGAA